MNKVKQGALALSLLAGAALVSAPPRLPNSIHDNGHFGGSWSRIGPSHHHAPLFAQFLPWLRSRLLS